ncbi:hypothetical protein KY346_02560 [Candidatus Woesearchaeota archaeon]|nr:hypothetical protein [Candidatus Woesearchaeota archaeon]
MNWPEYKDRLKRYFWFNKKEMRELVLLIFLFAFIFSFDKWGVEKFDLLMGIKSLVLALIIVAISVFIHHAVQRLAALYLGYRPESRIWWLGILIGIVVLIFSNGRLMIFAGSYFMIHMLTAQRLGKHRYGPSITSLGYVAMLGPLANVLFAGLLKMLNYGIGSAFLESMIGFNFMLAIYNVLPFPPLDGSKMFFGSRLAYAFFLGMIASFLVLVYVLGFSVIASIIISFLLGAVCWIVFYLLYERFVF